MVKWLAANFSPQPQALIAILNFTWEWSHVTLLYCQVYILISDANAARICSSGSQRLKLKNVPISTKPALGSIARRFCPCSCSQRTKLQSKVRVRAHEDKELMLCPYIFPSTSRCPGNYIQEGVGQVTVTIEGVIPTTKCDVAEIPAWRWKRPTGKT